MKKKSLLVTLPLLFMAITISAQEAKYEFKSAIIKKTLEMMGRKIEGTEYIDDYGNLSSATIANVRTVYLGDEKTFTTVDLEKKIGEKRLETKKSLNISKATPEEIEKYTIVELGEEEYLGKTCKKYSYYDTRMGQKFKIFAWVWKGVSLKLIYYSGDGEGVAIMEYITEFQENVTVDPEHFSIPADADIKFKDS